MGYLKGFLVSFAQQGKKQRVTTSYPEEKRPKALRLHGRHVLNRYEDGLEKCIGCELCAGVCPAKCIYVRGKDNPPEAPMSPGERWGFIYEINYLRCIHCDLCVEACPTEAITESKLFEFSFTNREDAIYTRRELLVDQETGKPQHMPWEDWREGEDGLTSAWMRATSPGGDADYEGVVAWGGELGYGVRQPESIQEVKDDPATDPTLITSEIDPKMAIKIFERTTRKSRPWQDDAAAGNAFGPTDKHAYGTPDDAGDD